MQTLPVLHLRESATKMGLLRKQHGMLLATSRGRSLRGDPAGLWWHLADGCHPGQLRNSYARSQLARGDHSSANVSICRRTSSVAVGWASGG